MLSPDRSLGGRNNRANQSPSSKQPTTTPPHLERVKTLQVPRKLKVNNDGSESCLFAAKPFVVQTTNVEPSPVHSSGSVYLSTTVRPLLPSLPNPGLHVPSTPSLAARAGRSRRLATAAEPSPSTAAPPVDPRIDRIVDDISGLTLLQATDLVSLLKARPASLSSTARVS